MWDGLTIDKVLAQLHVLPQRLHLPQRQGVVLVADPYHRELVGDLAVVRLQPRHERLVPLEQRDHVLGIGRRVGERPLDPGFDDPVAAHVNDAHLSGAEVQGCE